MSIWLRSPASATSRAAAACNVTQPTLSAGIKQLEEGLGVLIVERRQRFVGFTAEGERVLAWAHRVLADYVSLEQELSELREGLEGRIRIGAVPVSLPAVALLTAPFAAKHPRTRFEVISQTSVEIQRGLDDFTIDAGITYLDNEPLSRVRTQPLFREHYVLITHDEGSFADLDSISWAQAATLPLCLLTPSMQNRRIIDANFRAAGAEIRAAIETNSLVTPVVSHSLRTLVDGGSQHVSAAVAPTGGCDCTAARGASCIARSRACRSRSRAGTAAHA